MSRTICHIVRNFSIERRIEFQSFTKKEMNWEQKKRRKSKIKYNNKWEKRKKGGQKTTTTRMNTAVLVTLLQSAFFFFVFFVEVLYRIKQNKTREWRATCSIAWLRNDVCTFVLVRSFGYIIFRFSIKPLVYVNGGANICVAWAHNFLNEKFHYKYQALHITRMKIYFWICHFTKRGTIDMVKEILGLNQSLNSAIHVVGARRS